MPSGAHLSTAKIAELKAEIEPMRACPLASLLGSAQLAEGSEVVGNQSPRVTTRSGQNIGVGEGTFSSPVLWIETLKLSLKIWRLV